MFHPFLSLPETNKEPFIIVGESGFDGFVPQMLYKGFSTNMY